ncbi:MAG TPA: hypothetical protein VNN72_11570 [Polyangiaceae bacterium]|nr:hypothetical protein [Polyangiaceae bacterium]
MPAQHARFRLLVSALLGAFSVLACAAPVKLVPIAERTYQLECRQALATCLVRVQELCSSHGYDVLTATERRETSGASPVEGEYVKSSATVRCRVAVPVFGQDPNPPPPPIASTAPASAPASAPPPNPASAPPPNLAPSSTSPPSPSSTSAPGSAPSAEPPILPNPLPLPPRP